MKNPSTPSELGDAMRRTGPIGPMRRVDPWPGPVDGYGGRADVFVAPKKHAGLRFVGDMIGLLVSLLVLLGIVAVAFAVGIGTPVLLTVVAVVAWSCRKPVARKLARRRARKLDGTSALDGGDQ